MTERKAMISAAMRAAQMEFENSVAGLGEADWERPSPCEGWSIKDIVAHMTVSLPGLTTMVRRIVSGEASAVEGFDIDRYNQRQVDKRRNQPVTDLLGELSEARHSAALLLSELDESQLAKRGVRTTGEEGTAEDLFYQMARHDAIHAADVRTALGR